MTTKIVLNKKNAKDDFGIITIRSFSLKPKNPVQKKIDTGFWLKKNNLKMSSLHKYVFFSNSPLF